MHRFAPWTAMPIPCPKMVAGTVSASRYSAKALRLVQERVRSHAALIHDILGGQRGTLADLQAILQGEAITIAAPKQEAA